MYVYTPIICVYIYVHNGFAIHDPFVTSHPPQVALPSSAYTTPMRLEPTTGFATQELFVPKWVAT